MYIHAHTVHGFAQASYEVEEGRRLDTTFGLNIKGTSTFPNGFAILGDIVSEPGTARESTSSSSVAISPAIERYRITMYMCDSLYRV